MAKSSTLSQIKGGSLIEPLSKELDKNKIKSFSGELEGEVLNQAEIDAANQRNADALQRAEDLYGQQLNEYDSLKQRADQMNMVRDVQRNLDRGAGLRDVGGRSVSAGSGAYLNLMPGGRQPKLPTFMQPKLETVPKPDRAKISMTMQTPPSGSKKQPKDIISLTLKSTSAIPKNGARMVDLFNDMDKLKNQDAFKDPDDLATIFTTQLGNAFDLNKALNKNDFVVKDSQGNPFKGKTNLTLEDAFAYKIWQISDFVNQLPKKVVGKDKNTGLDIVIPDYNAAKGEDQIRMVRWYKSYMNPVSANDSVLTLARSRNPASQGILQIVPGAMASGRYADGGDYTASSWFDVEVVKKSSGGGAAAMMPLAGGGQDDYEAHYKINGAGKKLGEALSEISDMIAKDNGDYQGILRTTGVNREQINLTRQNSDDWNTVNDAAALWFMGRIFPRIDNEHKNILKRAASDTANPNKAIKTGITYRATTSDIFNANNHSLFRYVNLDEQSRRKASKYQDNIYDPEGSKMTIINPITGTYLGLTP